MLKRGPSAQFAETAKAADLCGDGHSTIEVKNKRAFVVNSPSLAERLCASCRDDLTLAC